MALPGMQEQGETIVRAHDGGRWIARHCGRRSELQANALKRATECSGVRAEVYPSFLCLSPDFWA